MRDSSFRCAPLKNDNVYRAEHVHPILFIAAKLIIDGFFPSGVVTLTTVSRLYTFCCFCNSVHQLANLYPPCHGVFRFICPVKSLFSISLGSEEDGAHRCATSRSDLRFTLLPSRVVPFSTDSWLQRILAKDYFVINSQDSRICLVILIRQPAKKNLFALYRVVL